MKKFTWALFFAFFVFGPLQAQEDELAPVTGTVAVTNVNIVPAPGQLIERGTVLVKNGLITAVGKNVTVPPGARVIKADSMYLYSGFILGMSHAGIKMPEQKDPPKVDDPGNPPNDVAGITPERSVNDYLDPGHKSLSDWRELGFTLAQIAPEGGMLPGTASIAILKGKAAGDLVLEQGTSLYASFDGARRMYPATIVGVMAKYRELYRQAEQSKQWRQSYLNDPTGKNRPAYDKTLEALNPVIDKKIPVAFKASELLEVQRALALQEELGFRMIITELKEGWGLENDIKNSGSSVLFSLDLPEWKEEKKDTAKKEKMSAEKQRLEERRVEAVKKHYNQMGSYASSGIAFGFSGLAAKTGDVHKSLVKIVETGLSEDDALAALTTNPAALLGISKIAGTVESGKMANLVISTNPYFTKDSKVKYVMVEGVVYEYDLKKPKKADPAARAAVVGTWNYSGSTSNGTITGTIVLEEEGSVLSGRISNSMTNDNSTMEDIVLADNKLSFTFTVTVEGQSFPVQAVLTISGDSFDGNISGAGQVFTITGNKVPGI